MNLKQLEAFVKVAEDGSFSKAAKDLYLTQPTVSAHISALERELEVRLFIRNTKEVAMSEDGQELYKYAKQMIDLERQIEERFNVQGGEGNHCITIAASTIPAQYLLPKALIRFKEKYPEEQFKVVETDSAQVVKQIVDGIADVGFTGTVLEKKYCKYLPFYKDKLNIITPNTEKYQAIKETFGEDISWLHEEHVIMREEGSGTRKEAEKQLKKAGIMLSDLDVIASIDNQETIKATEILANEGFIVMPYMYPDLNTARDLVNAGAATIMPLASPIGSNKGLATKDFIQILIDEIDAPIIVDAGIGSPAQACEAMQMGAAAIMANTALATAGDLPLMASAFKDAIAAGRKAYRAGLGRVLTRGAAASDPLTGFLRD